MPGRCELNCSWSLIAALFHKLTFLPSITDPVQDKSVKTDLVQFTNKIKVWSGKYIKRNRNKDKDIERKTKIDREKQRKNEKEIQRKTEKQRTDKKRSTKMGNKTTNDRERKTGRNTDK